MAVTGQRRKSGWGRSGIRNVCAIALMAAAPGAARAQDGGADADPSVRLVGAILGRIINGPAPAQGPIADLDKLLQQTVTLQNAGDAAGAEAKAKEALAFARTIPAKDDAVLIVPLINLSSVLLTEGKNLEAEESARSALEIAVPRLGPKNRYTVMARDNVSRVYRATGRFADAEALALQVIADAQGKFSQKDQFMIGAINGLGALYNAQGRFAEAEPLFVRALALSEKLYGKDDPMTLGMTSNVGTARLALLRLDEAESLLTRAAAGLEKAKGFNYQSTRISYNALGGLYRIQKRYREAEALLLRIQAGIRSEGGPETPLGLEVALNLGAAYQAQGKRPEAIRVFETVLASTDRVFGAEHPISIKALGALAEVRLTEPRLAATALKPARSAAEALRARRAQGLGDFTSFEEGAGAVTAASTFKLLADADWEGARAMPGQKAILTLDAFKALQDATAGTTDRAVLRMAIRHVADQHAGGLGELAREREGLADRLQANAAQMSAAFSASRRDNGIEGRLSAQRTTALARIEAIDAQIKRSFPEYFTLLHPAAMEVSDVQRLLQPDEATILVVPGKFGTHIFAVTRTTRKWVRSAWTDRQINDAVLRLLVELGATLPPPTAGSPVPRPQTSKGDAFDRSTAYALYQQLIAPVSDILAGKKQVYIAAEGRLSGLPFGVLVTSPPTGFDGEPAALRATPWLHDRYALVQIPSLQTLEFLRTFAIAGRSSDYRSFIGFGAPNLSGRSEVRGAARAQPIAAASLFSQRRSMGGNGFADPAAIRNLDQLPGTADELRSMRDALNAPRESVFLGDQATETRIRSIDLSKAGILAIATHGVMAGEFGPTAEPGLIFTPPKKASDADDGYLAASEISGLRLDADWVILSACNTAAGDGSNGAAGLSGLARAFFYAGARNLLVSHWPVRDAVAARLTVRTLLLQKENVKLTRAEALQKAMREVREDTSYDASDDSWAHPNAWAPFTLVGGGR
jgi:CHAT domain-containing protein/tetratricopeptide (TPR) repeat protein